MSNYVPSEWISGTCVTAERMNNIETGLDNVHKELKHPVTFVVAANNSSTNEKAGANYVCDGVADDYQIQDALINAHFTNTDGGRVRLLSGTYYINATINPFANTILEGSGHSTILKATTTLPHGNAVIKNMAFNSPTHDTGIVIRDLVIDGNRAVLGLLRHSGILLDYSDNTLVERVWITGTCDPSIYIMANCNNTHITGCTINDCLRTAIFNDAAPYTKIQDNQIIGDGTEMQHAIANYNGDYATISGNTVDGNYLYNHGIYNYNGAHNCIVTDNIVMNCRNSGIYTYNSNYTIITNNYVYNTGSRAGAGSGSGYGIHLLSATGCIIANNICEYNEMNGIFTDTSTLNIISDNILKNNSWNQDNTWNQLNIAIDCDRNLITGNMLRQPATGNKPKYGIYNYTGNLNNIIVHNDLYDSAYTVLQDNGTGTVTTLATNQLA